jgi:lipopolysaccharide transport system ATP-binding protein
LPISFNDSQVAIRCHRLGKHFASSSIDPERKFHARLEAMLRRLLIRPDATKSEDPGFWALRDVSFEVQIGEVFGIVGGNGAGKSCLLKILSGVTKPSEGFAELCGAVGSILQLGIFMHGELSGRENIYHCSALLRIPHKQIDRRFNNIVRFAGVESFLEEPVKHYSTGMRMRLAFSVMTELDAPILLIDEALSIGDEAFRLRCEQRLAELRSIGRTIVIVSHDLELIERMCQRAMLLQQGRIKGIGPTTETIADYRAAVRESEPAWDE